MSHWYLDADAKTILFLFREERDFLKDLDGDGDSFGTESEDAGETLCCVLLPPLSS